MTNYLHPIYLMMTMSPTAVLVLVVRLALRMAVSLTYLLLMQYYVLNVSVFTIICAYVLPARVPVVMVYALNRTANILLRCVLVVECSRIRTTAKRFSTKSPKYLSSLALDIYCEQEYLQSLLSYAILDTQPFRVLCFLGLIVFGLQTLATYKPRCDWFT